MSADPLLSQDELDFIQHLQHAPQVQQAGPTSRLLVNGDGRTKALLTRLVANEQVTLQASVNNQQITFPLHVVEDEFHALHLQLGSPEIYEDGPMLRAWRLALEQPCALHDAQGQASSLWVRDLSFKGMLVEVRGQAPAPAQFELQFIPPGLGAITLHGELRRRIGADLAAYDLGHSAADEIERLRDYVLHAHRQAHPELHAQVSS
ncbi:PilZ domain-containing protein [Pseudomonas cremoricolorata]|uniref:PilZ domain-containing protein n=1 Tax=Pseudomonas cremoricolorata TaxID=157783 RepID=UPI00048FB3C7|nr:PilZ domain-containing protein [Pseudomonas cremoricolorata]